VRMTKLSGGRHAVSVCVGVKGRRTCLVVILYPRTEKHGETWRNYQNTLQFTITIVLGTYNRQPVRAGEAHLRKEEKEKQSHTYARNSIDALCKAPIKIQKDHNPLLHVHIQPTYAPTYPQDRGWRAPDAISASSLSRLFSTQSI